MILNMIGGGRGLCSGRCNLTNGMYANVQRLIAIHILNIKCLSRSKNLPYNPDQTCACCFSIYRKSD